MLEITKLKVCQHQNLIPRFYRKFQAGKIQQD